MSIANPRVISIPVIKSIQYGSITIAAAATSNTDTITAVDTTNSFLLHLDSSTTVTDKDFKDFETRLALTNATTVTATRNGTTETSTINFVVIELHPGNLKSNQSGTITIASGTASNTDTITAVDTAKSILLHLGLSTSTSTLDAGEDVKCKLALTNATTVTATRNGTSADTNIVSYQIIEFL